MAYLDTTASVAVQVAPVVHRTSITTLSSPAQVTAYGVPGPGGAIIGQIPPGSTLEGLGFRSDDAVLEADGTAILTAGDFVAFMGKDAAKTGRHRIEVWRDQSPLVLILEETS